MSKLQIDRRLTPKARPALALGVLSLAALVAVSGSLRAEPTVLEIATAGIDGGWIEVSSLERDLPPIAAAIDDRLEAGAAGPAAPFSLDVSRLGRGLAMVCRGASGLGVFCEPLYLEPGVVFVIDLAPGLAVQGSWVRGGLPLPGVRVGVVPAQLAAGVPFTLPLESEGDRLRREAVSDEQGRFELPPLAPGAYFLEAILPGGRAHRSEVFTLPDPASFRLQQGPGAAGPAIWDLGEIVAGEGFDVEVRVSDSEGRPIAGARVAARQGASVGDLVSFDAITDAEGSAELSGFSLESPATIVCQARGHREQRLVFEQVPALVECELEPLAGVSGQVLDLEDQPIAAATVSVRRADRAKTLTKTRSAPDGHFELGELAGGSYVIVAAAPGFEPTEIEVAIEVGERLVLEPLRLVAAPELRGRVVDGATGEPLAGILLTIEEPAGAGTATSDAEGEFLLGASISRRLVLRSLSEDYVSEEHVFEPAALASGEPLVIELRRGGWLRVVIWDVDTDLPCQGCRVIVHRDGEELLTDAWGEAYGGPYAPGFLEVERPEERHLGSLVIEHPLAEKRAVSIRAGKLSEVRFELGGDQLRLHFEPAAPAGWWLEARALVRGLFETRGPTRSERRTAEPDGTFLIQRKPGEALGFYLLYHDPEAGAQAEVRVGEVTATDRRTELTMQLHDTLVEGRLESEGEPLARVRVRAIGLADSLVWAEARTAGDGSFRIPHLTPGGYSLTAGARTLRFLTVPSSETLDLGVFELVPGSF